MSDVRPGSPSRRITLKGVLALVLLVIVVVLVAANFQKVNVDLLFESYDVPLAVVVALVAFLSLTAGWLVGRYGVVSWLLNRGRKP